MVTAFVWVLCRLLPQGFRARQHAEWTGDLIALSSAANGGGAVARWRYLFAAAWTLPSLRAHARRAGLDRPQTMVPATIPAKFVSQSIVIGLGVPIVCWLIAVPFRWYLLDVPARFAASRDFDPKDLWPVEGVWAWLTPLWMTLHLGAWAMIISSFLVTWVGATAAIIGPIQRGATGRQRFYTTLLGVAFIVIGNAVLIALGLMVDERGPLLPMNDGIAGAVIGAIGVVTGLLAHGLTRRSRAALLTVSLLAIAIFAFHLTPLGEAMASWLMD